MHKNTYLLFNKNIEMHGKCPKEFINEYNKRHSQIIHVSTKRDIILLFFIKWVIKV